MYNTAQIGGEIMAYYLGIDVGKYFHQAILCNQEGKPLAPQLKFAVTKDGYQQLQSYLTDRVPVEEIQIVQAGFEATGPYWLSLYEFLTKLGTTVVVLNPLQVKAYRNESIRGAKTDKIDARLIIKVLRVGDYRPSAIPSEELFALRQLTRLRSDLVLMTTKIKVKIITIFDQVFPEYRQFFSDMFGTTSKALLEEAVVPERIAVLSTQKLTTLLKKASRGHYGEKQAQHIRAVAKDSIGVTIGLDAFALSIQVLLAQVRHLEQQVQRLDKEIIKRTEKQQTTLTSIPGIGRIQEATILAEIGNFDRFKGDKDGAEKLVALAGIDPKVRESGTLRGKARMSKRGSPYLRTAVRQVAFVAACGTNVDPMFSRIYQKKKAEGKHFEVALSHVENKLLHVIYSLLKSKKNYTPH